MRRLASASASRSTSRSPMWFARMSTSAASKSALCSSLKPRCASTMARNASSGLAKFELVESAISKPRCPNLDHQTSIKAGRARQRRIQRRSCRVPEARRDIAVRAQQIGRPGLCVITFDRKALGIDEPALAADADDADLLRRIDVGAIAEFQQREAPSFPDK